MKVLIVEDNVDGATSLGELLELWHHQVAIVFSGNDAVPAAHRFNPDVVLLDIGLPGMSGYEVAKLMREDPSFTHTTLVAMTAYNEDENRLEAEGARFDHYLVKPPDLHSLFNLLYSGGGGGLHVIIPVNNLPSAICFYAASSFSMGKHILFPNVLGGYYDLPATQGFDRGRRCGHRNLAWRIAGFVVVSGFRRLQRH